MRRSYSKWMILPAGAVLCLLLTSAWQQKKPRFHSHDDMLRILLNGELPAGGNSLFLGSGKCGGCHGHDQPVNEFDLVIANQTSEGIDVNPTDDWRATMMANSAKDPFWQAKVTHEVAINPAHQEALEDKCTSCHAPLGRYASAYDGNPHYAFATLVGTGIGGYDTLGMDGVSCVACHQQRGHTLGQQFSGVLDFSPDTIIGPYISELMEFPIFYSPMTDFVGFMPVGHEKVEKSEMCAGCHTLLTHSVDLQGQFTGTDFVEQATYHEWLNSAYNNDLVQQKQCQGCHMPRLEEPIIIASGYNFLPGRSPFGQHWLVGGNTFMLELMKNRIEELNIAATPAQFDKVIDRTMQLLTQETATIELFTEDIDGDTARYRVKVTNLAGHKFPSGYPSRRAYIEFTLRDAEGNILWQSGGMGPGYEVFGQNADYEPHYNTINQSDQVQIYELVMGDVNGNVTTVLERAHHTLKDNRLVPLGFSTQHFAYDTTQIVGVFNDANFNYLNGQEGSGTDEIFYRVPVSGLDGVVSVSARLMYQSVPPKWNQEMFAVSTPKIDAFEEMYWQEGADPVQIAAAQTENLLVSARPVSARPLVIFPNPTADGLLQLQWPGHTMDEVLLYDNRGRWIRTWKLRGSAAAIELPGTRGTYLLEIHSGSEVRIEKVIRR